MEMGIGRFVCAAVCARGDQRRKNIKGKREKERGKSPNEVLGRKEGRPGQFSCLIYFPPAPDKFNGSEAHDSAFLSTEN